jgi:PAP2 superfamily
MVPLDGKSVLRLALTAILFAAILALTRATGFFPIAVFSGLIVLGMIRCAWVDVPWVLAVALLLSVIDYRIPDFRRLVVAVLSLTPFGGFAVLGTRAIWAEGEERKLLLYGFVPVAILVGITGYMGETLLQVTERLHPKTFDLFLYSFDSSLRVQLSFLVGQGFWKWALLRSACWAFYMALPLPLALVYAARLRYARSKALTAVLAFLVAGPLGVMFYNLVPACGPVYLFGPAFPWHPLSTANSMHLRVVPLLVKGAPNAIPSLHMAWVLLCWWNSKGLPRWVRAIALAFVWFTVLATMGTGEHYFIDLVVAFPFSLMVQALCSYALPFGSGERRIAFLFGIFVTLLWLALLSFAPSFFWISPLIPWAMVVTTVSSSVVLWHHLLQARSPEPPACALAAAAAATAAL